MSAVRTVRAAEKHAAVRESLKTPSAIVPSSVAARQTVPFNLWLVGVPPGCRTTHRPCRTADIAPRQHLADGRCRNEDSLPRNVD